MGLFKTLLLIVVGFLSFNNLSFQRQQESDDCSFPESNGVVDEKKGSIYVAPKSAFDDEYVVEANVEYNAGSAFNMSDYFRNLYDYSPLNRAGGSCGFVSLINLLTYYDTFYNDDIVPEQYDAHGAGFETPGGANTCSPGVQQYSYDEEDYQGDYSNYWGFFDGLAYCRFCYDTRAYDLQSELACQYNEWCLSEWERKNCEGQAPNFSQTLNGWEYKDTLNSFYRDFYGFDEMAYVESTGMPNTQQEHINFIKESIDAGHPVMVQLCNTYDDPDVPDSDHHAVVAYEYDDNFIYANFGWGNWSTHRPIIGDVDSHNHIWGAFRLEFPGFHNQHKHSDNYFYGGEGHCGCNVTDDIEIVNGGTATDFPPTLRWMKSPNDQTEEYYVWVRRAEDLSFHDTRWDLSGMIFLTSNQVTIGPSIWEYYLDSGASPIYFIVFRIGFYGEYEPAVRCIPRPSSGSVVLSVLPSDWIFNAALPYRVSSGAMVKNGTAITYRYRNCSNANGVISMFSIPSSTATFQSMLECSFAGLNVNRLDVALEFSFSDPGDDALSINTYLQYRAQDGVWKNYADLSNSGMDYVAGVQRRCYFVMPEPATAFRFVVSCSYSGLTQTATAGCNLKIGAMDVYLG